MYKLIAVDQNNKLINIYQSDEIFAIDWVTGEYCDRNELLNKLESNYKIKINDIFISYTSNDKERIIRDIAYSNVVVPEEEEMEKMYVQFLKENKERIKESFLKKVVLSLEEFDIAFALHGKFNSYRTRRECYFHMLREGKIKLKEVSKKKPDYIKSLIDEIDTDDMSDEAIMIEKIRSGEIEPFFYDIDEYNSIRRRHK